MKLITQGDRIRFQRSPADRGYLLEDQPQVMGTGPAEGPITIAFVGEAPGGDEARSGTPFIGRAGRFLDWGLSEAGIYRSGCYCTNVIDRQPPGNNIKSVEAKDAIEAQQNGFREEILYLVERGVRVILAFGNTAKDAFAIAGAITKVRGSVFEYNMAWPGPVVDPTAEPCSFVVIPTYHPSYLMRARWQGAGNERADTTQIWIADLTKAKEIADRGYTRPVENFTTNPTVDQVLEFTARSLTESSLLAIDLETAGFNPKKDAIICIGMATSGEDGICIPLYKTGPEVTPRTPYWTQTERIPVEAAIRRVLLEAPTMYQHSLFDVGFLQESGYDVNLSLVTHDTLLLHHAVNSELPHNLGFITSTYGSTPYWKEDFANRDTTIWKMDPLDLQTYNIRDCVVLHQVLQPLLGDLLETGTGRAYKESLSLIGPVLEMQATGLKLSRSRLAKFKEEVTDEITELALTLFSLGKLPEAFNLGSNDDLRLFLFGVKSSKFEGCADWETHAPNTKIRARKKSLHEVGEQTQCLYEHTYQGRKTSTGLIQVDKQGRTGLRIHLQNRLETIANLKRPTSQHSSETHSIKSLLEWLTSFEEYSVAKKLLSTYTSFPTRADGRVHTRYVIHGTVTGRLSSREPNLQNLPKKETRVRKCFVAPPGFVIVSADFSNLEFGTMAYETQDPVMIETFENPDLNQHDENTKAMFGITEKDAQWSLARRAAKIFQFGSQYGGGDRQVYENVIQEVPEMNLTFARFQQMKSAYMNAHPTYAQWRTRTIATAETTRKISNAFGRVRILYGPEKDIGKEALNFPCQSAAAHVMNVATNRIWKRLREGKLTARLQGQVHDQLLVECPQDEVHTVVSIMRREMERPLTFYGRTVTFPVDFETGPSWGDLQEYHE